MNGTEQRGDEEARGRQEKGRKHVLTSPYPSKNRFGSTAFPLSLCVFRDVFQLQSGGCEKKKMVPEAETLARSMDPGSLKPEPLLGFLRDPKTEILEACNHIERDANVKGRNPAPTASAWVCASCRRTAGERKNSSIR